MNIFYLKLAGRLHVFSAWLWTANFVNTSYPCELLSMKIAIPLYFFFACSVTWYFSFHLVFLHFLNVCMCVY